jgi:hypothetical protein
MNVGTALLYLIALTKEISALAAAINKAESEGRKDLTDEEVASFAGRDDAARARLQAKIDALPK